MFVKSPVPFTDVLTTLQRAARQRLASISLPEAGIMLWLLLLLAGPILVFSQLTLQDQSQTHVEPYSHLLIESFCGLTALIIAGMLLSVSRRRHDPSMILFGLAFLVMGIFDLLHAWTDPASHYTEFVLYHTLSTFLGSVFIFAGVVVRVTAERNHGLSRTDLATVAIGLAVAVGLTALYRYFIPGLFSEGGGGGLGFSFLNHAVHYLAGLFYVLAGIAFYRYFHARNQILALLAFSLLVVFAQSAYLFSLSGMWNLAWWVWHGIKLLFYLGAMLIVFVGFLLALRTIDKSRYSLARANRRLERSQRSIQRFNHELEIRNRMVREAMLTLNLDNTLDVVAKAIHELLGLISCELILRIPQDELDEFDCRARRFSKHWSVQAMRDASICNSTACHAILPVEEVFECGYRDDWGCQSVCLSLTANGHEIGRLRLRASRPDMNVGALGALANEVGAIVHNALLYHQSLDANYFRLALLRVSNMLTSTLDMDRVLEAVCEESAALLESDGALVWLPDNKNKAEFYLAAKWFGQTEQQGSGELEAWCRDGNHCSKLLEGISGHYQPISVLWRDVSQPTPFSKPKGCPWEALALFPLLDGENLIGVMVLMRTAPVRFSVASLDKGVLLAGQVRIAINNAQSFTRLAESNQQLKLAEETKIRSERMAVMGQMAASVAHEVRNPLSAINNCLAVLRSDVSESARSSAALEIIQDEVERLTNLTSNFLSFGKPRASVSKAIVLEQVVKKTCALLERHISQEELCIQLQLNIEPVSSLLVFDADGLEAVFWNLLLNATQSIHESGRIEVTLRHYPGHFLLVVADSGKGIAREDQTRIFEPFYSQRPLGAGLGLAIVQRLVREWGGGIRLRSQVGQGTAFFLRVPARVDGSFDRREVA